MQQCSTLLMILKTVLLSIAFSRSSAEPKDLKATKTHLRKAAHEWFETPWSLGQSHSPRTKPDNSLTGSSYFKFMVSWRTHFFTHIRPPNQSATPMNHPYASHELTPSFFSKSSACKSQLFPSTPCMCPFVGAWPASSPRRGQNTLPVSYALVQKGRTMSACIRTPQNTACPMIARIDSMACNEKMQIHPLTRRRETIGGSVLTLSYICLHLSWGRHT